MVYFERTFQITQVCKNRFIVVRRSECFDGVDMDLVDPIVDGSRHSQCVGVRCEFPKSMPNEDVTREMVLHRNGIVSGGLAGLKDPFVCRFPCQKNLQYSEQAGLNDPISNSPRMADIQ